MLKNFNTPYRNRVILHNINRYVLCGFSLFTDLVTNFGQSSNYYSLMKHHCYCAIQMYVYTLIEHSFTLRSYFIASKKMYTPMLAIEICDHPWENRPSLHLVANGCGNTLLKVLISFAYAMPILHN